jgi:hypothetical protein
VYFSTAPDASPHRVHEISHALFAEDQPLYWRLVYGMLFESPAECEEYALRWRANRLQDLGFPDLEQAMRVYRPLPVERVSDWVPPGSERALVESIQLPRQLRGTLLGEALSKLPVARGWTCSATCSASRTRSRSRMACRSPRASPSARAREAVRGIDAGLRGSLARAIRRPKTFSIAPHRSICSGSRHRRPVAPGTQAMTQSDHALSETWRAVLVIAFVSRFLLAIVAPPELGARPLDLLLLGASLGALVVGALAVNPGDAAQRRLGALVFSVALLIPYVNFVVASVYARRYWGEGARAPALLALAAIALETVASLRVFLPNLTPPV